MSTDLITAEPIETLILHIRGKRVILDADLALLYGVTTKRLNEQVKRNKERFPDDFMLVLTPEEKNELVANCDRLKNLKHSTVLPFAFAEHGVIMAANVLNARRAAEISIYVVRAFVKLREVLRAHHELESKLRELEHKIATHDDAIRSLFSAIRKIMEPPALPSKKIGFDL